MSIVVMADSGASLPKSVLKRKDICVMPLKLEFTDGKIGTLKSEEKFDETSCIPIIHRPNIMDIREEVTKYINKGYELFETMANNISLEVTMYTLNMKIVKVENNAGETQNV